MGEKITVSLTRDQWVKLYGFIQSGRNAEEENFGGTLEEWREELRENEELMKVFRKELANGV